MRNSKKIEILHKDIIGLEKSRIKNADAVRILAGYLGFKVSLRSDGDWDIDACDGDIVNKIKAIEKHLNLTWQVTPASEGYVKKEEYNFGKASGSLAFLNELPNITLENSKKTFKKKK